MNAHPVTRTEILQELRLRKPDLEKRFGVSRIGIFGSVARGQFRDDSDIDVVVEMAHPDLFYLVHIKEELQESLGRPVDVIQYRVRMNAFLKERIEKEAVYA
jgi:predicted nucleotidyltransferase